MTIKIIPTTNHFKPNKYSALKMVFKFVKARHLTKSPQYFAKDFSFNFIIPSLLFLLSNNTVVVNSITIYDPRDILSADYPSYLFDDTYNTRLIKCFMLNPKGKSVYAGVGININILMDYDVEKLQYRDIYPDFSDSVFFTKWRKDPDAFWGFDLANLVTEIGDKIVRTTKKSFKRKI